MEVIDEKCSDFVYISRAEPTQFADVVCDWAESRPSQGFWSKQLKEWNLNKEWGLPEGVGRRGAKGEIGTTVIA